MRDFPFRSLENKWLAPRSLKIAGLCVAGRMPLAWQDAFLDHGVSRSVDILALGEMPTYFT